MENVEESLERLKRAIESFVAQGGSIYQPRRQLPYYKSIYRIKKALSERDGKEYSVKDIYAMCGYSFDKDYDNHLDVVKNLSEIASLDGYLDAEKNFKECKPQTYGYLCTQATKFGSCLYDYLVIMTGYRIKDANINVDYELALVELLNQAYPTKDTTRIKREHPELFEMLNHLKEYRYPTLTTSQVIHILGFHNDRLIARIRDLPDKRKILKRLKELFPDMNVSQSLCSKSDIYYDIIQLSILENMGIVQWLNANGFKYIQGNLLERLSLMKVNEKQRYNYLKQQQAEFYKNKDVLNMTDKERYYANLELVKQVASKNAVEDFIKTDTYNEL